jgi:hypothetical protein
MFQPIVMELDKYITLPQPILTAYIINSPISNTNITAFQIAKDKPKIA